jgi:transcriptional regulator with XRE-family HTH domain
MKERLLQLLDLEQITPSKFADIIGVQRSSVSHVISGRNNPSFDFLHKTLTAFPGLNAAWLMLGEGTMYEQMGRKVPGNLFDAPEAQPEDQIPAQIPDDSPETTEILSSEAPPDSIRENSFASETLANKEKEEKTTSSEEDSAIKSEDGRKIVQVMVIYEDDTFRTFTPSH